MSQKESQSPQPCDLTRQELRDDNYRLHDQCPKCGHFIYDHQQAQQQQIQGKYHYFTVS